MTGSVQIMFMTWPLPTLGLVVRNTADEYLDDCVVSLCAVKTDSFISCCVMR